MKAVHPTVNSYRQPVRSPWKMASASARSDWRGRPPLKQWVFTRTGKQTSTAHTASKIRQSVLVEVFGE